MTRNLPRVPLEDLTMELQLHTDRRFVFVEGPDDVILVSWVLRQDANGPVNVFPVDDFEVPLPDSPTVGRTGARGRVLELADRIVDEVPSANLSTVRCFVDRDLCGLFGRLPSNAIVVVTDYHSIECYGLDGEVLERVAQVSAGIVQCDGAKLVDQLVRTLVPLCLLRAASHEAATGASWLPLARRCKVNGDGTIAFDFEQYRRDYLAQLGNVAVTSRLAGIESALANAVVGDERVRVRGHDFIEVLAAYLRHEARGKATRTSLTSDVVWRLVRTVMLDAVRTAPAIRSLAAVFAA